MSMSLIERRNVVEGRVNAALAKQDAEWLMLASDSAINDFVRNVAGDEWEWVLLRTMCGTLRVSITAYNGPPK